MNDQDYMLQTLQLTQRIAQGLKLQYDTDTNHGVKLDAQQSWESEVMMQLQELGLIMSPPSFKERESKKF